MSSQASGLRVASVIFAFFAVGHVVRLVKQAQVTVGTYQIPMWVSVVALIIAAILSTWMWRLSSARDLIERDRSLLKGLVLQLAVTRIGLVRARRFWCGAL